MKADRMAMALVAALVALALVCTVRMIRTAPEHRALIERMHMPGISICYGMTETS